MKPSHFSVPSSETVSTKKLVVKKLVSLLVAALTVSIATLDTAGELPTAVCELEVVSSARVGLSRQRPAFRKALSLLAEAASTNQRLADYYQRVTRRVAGAGPEGEENVGAGGVVAVRRSNPRRVGAPDIRPTASDAPSMVDSQSLVAVAYAAPISETNSTPSSSAEGDSQSRPEGEPISHGYFTVGDMAFDTNPAIEHWMNYYGATPLGRNTLKIGLERSNSYLEMARAEFRNAGVPEDLVWLAFVESVWNPRAVSPAAAGGIWQFIPAVATEYGLKVQSGNDERADPFKQTRAAAVYLRDLYTIFGDWTLAMAAYNGGEPGVMRAIVKNGNANFWELYDKQLLHRETCDYVPKILATIKLASQAEFYGLAPQAGTPVFAAG